MAKQRRSDTAIPVPSPKEQLRWAAENLADTALRVDPATKRKRNELVEAITLTASKVLKTTLKRS